MTWPIKPDLSLYGVILVIFACGGAYYRIGNLEAAVDDQKQADAKQDAAVTQIRQEIREDIKDINRKLDRLIERK
jgi:hypothetical protein